MWRKVGGIVLIVVVGAVIAVAVLRPKDGSGGIKISRPKKTDTKKEPNFEAARLGDLEITVDATGVTQPITDIEVKSEATGRIIEFYVEEGSLVKAGDIICKLDQSNQVLQVKQQELAVQAAKIAWEQARSADSTTALASLRSGTESAEASVRSARENLEKARSSLTRIEELHGKGYATEAELEAQQNAVVAAETQLKTAEISLKEAQTRLGEYSTTSDKNTIETARIRYEQSKVQLQDANRQLGNSVITSPIDGIVLEKLVDVGDSVVSINSAFGQSNPIVKVADLSRMKIRTYVDEVDIGKIETGQAAEITVDAFPGENFTGEVTNIFPQGQSQGGAGGLINFVVIIEVDNPDNLLLGNMTSSVQITARTLENVLLIPLAATRAGKTPGSTVVEVPTEEFKDNPEDPKAKTEEREIKLGDTNFVDTVVLEGLSEGEMVKVRGFASSIQFN